MKIDMSDAIEILKVKCKKTTCSFCYFYRKFGFEKSFDTNCVELMKESAHLVIADKDRQIEELKSEALEMAELVSILHPLGHDRAQEIIEKYTKESEPQNG